MKQRINRIISQAGLASRRQADELIKSGRVMLNGRRVCELGTKADWGSDCIKVDGKEIAGPRESIYIALNKPFGYISSMKDPEGRPVVTELIKDIPERLYPVGRLDFDSLGLLLMTNDGDFSYRLTHPKYHVPKTYKVTVSGNVDPETLEKLTRGVQLEDGFSGSAKAALLKKAGAGSIIRITVYQGRNRMVRRMMEAVGLKVTHLMRTGFGSLDIGDLKVGTYRHLKEDETAQLKKSVGLK